VPAEEIAPVADGSVVKAPAEDAAAEEEGVLLVVLHSLHVVRIFLCSQMLAPPQSLHR